MMKATVYYKDGSTYRQKTVKVEKNEPNHIIQQFYEQTRGVFTGTWVSRVKCNNTIYQWDGTVKDAGVY